jgi:flagellar biogenesis protein FliO
MDNLFGMEITGAARFIIAFVVVLVLIAVTAWLVRRFGSGALASAGGRGRQPRLAVIDAATVDARRKLILVRRDNVEHLLMIGGPSDVVIEPNIVRASTAARDTPAPRVTPAAEAMPRPVPLDDEAMSPLQPEPQARPQHAAPPVAQQWSPATPQRPSPAVRTPPPPDNLADLADAISARTPPRIEHEPQLVQPPELQPAAPYATPANDKQLAEMAQRLEAVLRRPAAGEPRVEIPVVTPPSAKAEVHASNAEHHAEPRAKEPKRFYETIEQEMASLLGRPTGKT